jgi:hypothetical protein
MTEPFKKIMKRYSAEEFSRMKNFKKKTLTDVISKFNRNYSELGFENDYSEQMINQNEFILSNSLNKLKEEDLLMSKSNEYKIKRNSIMSNLITLQGFKQDNESNLQSTITSAESKRKSNHFKTISMPELCKVIECKSEMGSF